MTNYGIPGLSWTGETPPAAPILLVIGGPKSGKSSAVASLIDWPVPGAQPLVLAFDENGIDSIAQLGYRVAAIRVRDQPGDGFWAQTTAALQVLETAFARQANHPFRSLVVDCGSTMSDRIMQEVKQTVVSKDTRQLYGLLLDRCKQVYWRIKDIGVPVVWLAWLQEPFIKQGESGKKAMKLGGPLMDGSFKDFLAGSATQILYLEKVKAPPGPGVDQQGYARIFHTRTYNMIEAGGRYSQFLPEPSPVHLGWILTQIMSFGGATPIGAPAAR